MQTISFKWDIFYSNYVYFLTNARKNFFISDSWGSETQ